MAVEHVTAPPGSPPSDDELRGRVALGTLASIAAQAVSLASWFFLTPFMVRSLGPSAFGLWAVATAFAGYVLLLDFGVRSAVVKHVAELRATGELERLRRFVATAFWLLVGIAAFVIALTVVLAPFAPSVFGLPAAARNEATLLFVLVGVNAALTLVGGITYDVLAGIQRYDLLSLIGVVGTLVTTGALVGVLVAGGGVVALGVVSLVLTVVMQLPALLVLRLAAPDLRLTLRGDRSQLRPMLSFSLGVLVIGISGAIQTRTDEVVVGAVRNVREVTSYTIARRLSEAPNLLAAQLARVLLPVASELGAAREDERLRHVLATSTRVTLAGFLPIGCALAVFAHPFIGAWVGEGLAGSSDVLRILLLAGAIDVMLWPAGYVLVGTGRHRTLAWFAASSALVNLGLSIALVGPLGTKGVALGTLMAGTAEAVLLVVPYTLRVTGLRARRALTQSLLPALAPLVPELLVLYAIEEVFQPRSLLGILLAGAAGAAAYGAVYLRLPPCTAERLLARRAGRWGAVLIGGRLGGGRA